VRHYCGVGARDDDGGGAGMALVWEQRGAVAEELESLKVVLR